MSSQPEPWLSGTHGELPAVIRAVVHALELSRADVDRWCASLSTQAFNARPAGIAPVSFHLRHIVRSLDRLLTYAEGESLSAEQLVALKAELDGDVVLSEAMAEFHAGIESALGRVKSFAGADLEKLRQIGRKGLPTSVGGLLVHCADHTQRHTGQAVTTAKIVQAENSPA